ncbi:MAG: hypothetical protein K0S26_3407 [Bacteroidota bacterium]|nr:hypothetical protein [Bacteroidota bacterium]
MLSTESVIKRSDLIKFIYINVILFFYLLKYFKNFFTTGFQR